MSKLFKEYLREYRCSFLRKTYILSNSQHSPIKPKITMRGFGYIANNSTIAKAKEMLKMAGKII